MRRKPDHDPAFAGFFRSLQGTIPTPPRQGRIDAVLILLAVGLFAASGPAPAKYFHLFPPAFVLLSAVGLARRSPYAVHAALAGDLAFGVWAVPALNRLWPLPLLLILVSYGAAVACVPWLRPPAPWLKGGGFDRSTGLWTVLFGLVAAGGVTAWRFLAHPDLSRSRALFPTGVPWWSLPMGIVLYAALNAAYEEILRRGILTQSLEAALGRGRAALALQAAGFGFWHYHGFPSGWLGVALAGLFALMMGVLRRRSGGMLAPWIAHTFTDSVIYILVAFLVLGS